MPWKNAGVRVSNEPSMCQVAKSYFDELFQEQNNVHAPVVNVVTTVITYNDNTSPTAPFQIHEFKKVVFPMHLDECHGLDGFNLGIFQHFQFVCICDIF